MLEGYIAHWSKKRWIHMDGYSVHTDCPSDKELDVYYRPYKKALMLCVLIILCIIATIALGF